VTYAIGYISGGEGVSAFVSEFFLTTAWLFGISLTAPSKKEEDQ